MASNTVGKIRLLAMTAMAAAMAGAGELTVVGRGVVRLAADQMCISFTVSAADKEMALAKRLFEERTAAMKATLGEAGVTAAEIATGGMEMHQEFDYSAPGGRQLTGYRFAEAYTLTASIDMPRLERIYASLVDSQSPEGLGVAFGLADPDSARRQARERAVADARTVAEDICRAAGMRLKGIEEIAYGTSIDGGRVVRMEDGANLLMAKGTSLGEIAAREVEVADTVTIRWEIR